MSDATPPATDEIVLRECPFCGGDAHIGTVRYSRPLDDVRWSEDDAPVTEAFYGHCARCSAGHRNSFAGGHRTTAEAARAWNTRTPPDLTELMGRQAREIAALREGLEKIAKAYDEWDPDASFASTALAQAASRARAIVAQSAGEG